jgi:hypothetical protein
MKHFYYPTECFNCGGRDVEYTDVMYDETTLCIKYTCKACRHEMEIRVTYVTLQALST